MEPLFLADSLVKEFGSNEALKAASAWATPGRITVLLGRNGCGKSTLIRVSLGLVPRRQGVVHFDGRGYRSPRLATLARRGLFYLPDRGCLSRRHTLRWHLDAIRKRASFPVRGEEAGARFLETLRVRELLDLPAGAMSGGEKRRAELALALARAPACLIADEPLTGITPLDQELMIDHLRQLARRGCAILITGHEVDLLMTVADEIIWMAAGTTHGIGSPEAAKAHDQFRREYLGVPAADRIEEARTEPGEGNA